MIQVLLILIFFFITIIKSCYASADLQEEMRKEKSKIAAFKENKRFFTCHCHLCFGFISNSHLCLATMVSLYNNIHVTVFTQCICCVLCQKSKKRPTVKNEELVPETIDQ